MPARILRFPSCGARGDFGITLLSDECSLPRGHTVEIVRLHFAAREHIDAAQNVATRHLGVARPFDPAYEPLIDADLIRDLRLCPSVQFAPFRERQCLSPRVAPTGNAKHVPEYDVGTYLVNGHGEIAEAYYAAVAYVYVMHPGNRLRSLRKAARLTQAELAERTGFGQDRISNYENGRRPMRLQEMRVLARELSCSVADILSDDDNPERLSAEERMLLQAFRASSATARQFLLTSANAVAEDRDHGSRKSAS